jgi:hypothetical protein
MLFGLLQISAADAIADPASAASDAESFCSTQMPQRPLE